ncbi:MAG: TolC family protein, partial [Gammaproteobacteria bacterium]|nr:TolC family protein [Gammaproteobacteria bacterium]NIW40933.1 TolC family protein [candidate division Zixibacteria bacterium]NIX58878.1 TolC family protein [candidate division Zixibacteria bacterium]
MKFLSKILLSICVLLSTLAYGQSDSDTLFLSLDEAIEIAQSSSPSGKMLNESLNSSHWNYLAFRSNLLPALSLSGSAPGIQREISEITQPDGSVQYRERQQGTSSITANLSQQLPLTGGSLFISSSIDRVDLYSDGSKLWRASPLFLGLTQPILEFNSLKWSKRIQPLQYESAKKQYLEDMVDLST